MNRAEYLNALKNYLHGLSYDDITDVLNDINEHFDSGTRDNRSEKEISAGLGSPKEMAFAIKTQYGQVTKVVPSAFESVKALITFVTIGFTNIILLPLFLSIGILIGAMFLTLYSFFLAGGLFAVAPILDKIAPSLIVTGGVPIMLVPIVGFILLYLAYKGHRYMMVISKKLYTYALKFSKSHMFVLNLVKEKK